ncbi:MAG TPA: TetR/AcrR family transcriptional regulator [Actinocrinis sp.]
MESQSPPAPAAPQYAETAAGGGPAEAALAEAVLAEAALAEAVQDETAQGPGPGCPIAAAARRGRPRSEQAEEAIIDAVFTRFTEGASYDGLSMEAVASAAGVGKATIYRRWPNKETLVLEAIRRRVHPGPPVPAPGDDIRSDLIFLLEQMRSHVGAAAPVISVLIQAGATNPGLMQRYHDDVIEPRREVFRVALRRGVARGELRADLDVERSLRSLTACMLVATVLEPPHAPVGREYSVSCVDDFLLGAVPR